MDWSNDECLQLIDLYQLHPVLWNTKHSFHFSKNKKRDAWDEIAETLNRDVNIVKQKMTSLLGSFRAQKSKGKKIIGTGKGRKEIYISKWFAFKRMQFLVDRDGTNDTHDTEYYNEIKFSPIESSEDITELPSKASIKFKEKDDHKIKDAFRIFNETLEKYTSFQNQSSDRFTIYGQHIAAKLRTYSKNTQAIVEHSINDILFDADMGKFDTDCTISTSEIIPNEELCSKYPIDNLTCYPDVT